MAPALSMIRRASHAMALTLFACLAWGCASVPTSGGAGAESGERNGEVRAAPVPDKTLRHEVRVSYASNFFHWLDNLAGSTPGKTRDAYLRTWARYHDILGPEERAVLRRWRALRLRPLRVGNGSVPRQSATRCLPPDPGLSRRQSMSVAAMDADTLDDLRASLVPKLDAGEREAFEDALALFDAPFREIWEDAGYLQDFARALREELDDAEPSELVARMERFFGGRFEDMAPSRINLIALFAEDRGTHAEANGRHLLLEIRPSDRPRDQFQVVYHELAHDLFARIPQEGRDDWARWFLSRGAAGALAWNYQHEAIPTALGQGVAESRLAPSLWSARSPWYHRLPVDALAKAIYPRLRRAIFEGERMSERIAGDVVAATREELSPQAPLRAYLSTVAFVAAPEVRASLTPLGESLPAYRAWEVSNDSTGQDFIASYPCLPLVTLEVDPSAETVATPWTRESGAISLSIVARDVAEAERMAAQLARWPRWPEEPIRLED